MILFIGQVASDQRDREGVPGARLPPGSSARERPGLAKWVGEVTDPDRLPEYVARLPRRAAGPAGAGGPVAARGHADDRPPRPRCSGASNRPRPWPGPDGLARLRELLGRRAAVRDRRRQRVGRGGARAAALCRGLGPPAGGLRLPLPGPCSTTAAATTPGDVGIGINPKLAAHPRRRPGARNRRAPGRDETGGYALPGAAAGAEARAHPPGAEELGRVYAADLLLQSSTTPPAGIASLAPPHLALAPANTRRPPTTPPGPVADPRCESAGHGAGVLTLERVLEGDRRERRDLHQRRRQLHRLAAPPLPLPGLGGHGGPARADLGRDGLRPAGGRRGARCWRRGAPSSTSPATATSPDDRAGTRHRGGARRPAGSPSSSTAPTARSACTRARRFPGRVSGSDLFNPACPAHGPTVSRRRHGAERPASSEPALLRGGAGARTSTLLHRASGGGQHQPGDVVGHPRRARQRS